MPTYQVTAPKGRLAETQRAAIARCITESHCAATGAPKYFAQVIFNEVEQGNYYLGGALLGRDQVFVHGTIRAGRSSETKSKIMREIVQGIAALGIDPSCIWVYIADLPASQMIEFGRDLPEPGQEAAWTASLPSSERERLESIGREQQS
ncbi:tautomerase family protein [Bradyrhizobium sp. Ai1a-2]|uniref:tautomerase family protein n=1 Tax=Bradyrhizobium sp. Ai1a-2 TaxID=196490 RepID=UPI000420C155|nr:tautomerase family protein [Bradyrhizobium sp. Ai1a-2]